MFVVPRRHWFKLAEDMTVDLDRVDAFLIAPSTLIPGKPWRVCLLVGGHWIERHVKKRTADRVHRFFERQVGRKR